MTIERLPFKRKACCTALANSIKKLGTECPERMGRCPILFSTEPSQGTASCVYRRSDFVNAKIAKAFVNKGKRQLVPYLTLGRT